jgi:SNF2 family DNA or RNA helicase
VEAFLGLPAVKVPPTFKGTLRGYQRTGVDFLAFASSLGLGAILADDMGLGKTIQALAWIAWLRAQDPEFGPVLVVCPASVVHNWQREAERFTPTLAVARLTGAERRATLKREATRAHLWVTNYALMRRDIEELKTIEFGAVILDEAQNIKNPNTDVTRAARELKAKHRLALTGTPLENRALDLWSILSFASPGFLGSRRQFTARYDPVDAPPAVRRLLAARLRPVLLRRMKSVVAKELPPRSEERRDCELTPVQKKLYLEQVERARAILSAGMGDAKKLNEDRFQILAILTRMRQICDHPALVGAPKGAASGKFDALWELLEPLLAEGHKVLVFSQFVECLTLIGREMKERGIPHHFLTGKTNEKDREAVVQRFTEDPEASVFLVSLKAGGTGLNLTAASYVVLFDPWWNPAVEAQAIDRTHRIGQTRNVTAYRLLTRDTIEEKIWELQQKKATLAKEVLGEEGFAKALTREDLDWLIS